jgi:hypothetical protein
MTDSASALKFPTTDGREHAAKARRTTSETNTALRDLWVGMQPAPKRERPCKTKTMLESRLHADVRVYMIAVQAIEAIALRIVGHEAKFRKAVHDVHVSREAFIDARAKLNRHIASHGCA